MYIKNKYVYLYHTRKQKLKTKIMKTLNITELQFMKLQTSRLSYDEMKDLINSITVEGKSLTGSRQTSKLWCILINY